MTVAHKYLTVHEGLNVITRFDRTRVKRAELGGDGNDIPFEQAFSNLAHAYLRDKAPSLLDHEQGFQLLDRNQENTKAIGVFGFKVGSQQLFAPVFFLQGDLKGHELLYIKNQDLFVPMKENWLNYIVNRKPNTLGQGVNRNSAQLGIMGPSLDRLNSSPYKFSSALPPMFRDVMPALAHAAMTNVRTEREKFAQAMDLPTFLKQASLPMLGVLVDTMRRVPKFAKAFESYHGLDCLHDAVRLAKNRAKVASSVLDQAKPKLVKTSGSVLDEPVRRHPIKTGALKVVEYDTTQVTDLPKDLTEADREKLLKDTVLIKDERDDEDVSKAYNIRVEQKFFNPTEAGLYQVLTKPGELTKCFVAFHPHGPNGRVQFATLVRIDGEPDWVNIHPSRIFCASRIEGEDYDKWYDGLTEAKSLDAGTARYVLVGPRCNATLPFKVEKSLGDAKGETTYEVDFSDYCEYEYAESLLTPNNPNRYPSWAGSSNDPYSKYRDGQRIHLDGKRGTALRSQLGDVWIPEGYKLLTVKKSKGDAERDDSEEKGCFPCSPGADSRSEDEPLRPGNLLDAELAIKIKTAELSILRRGHEFAVNGASLRPTDALVHLVRDHGFREKVARHMLAEASTGRTFTCRVKYANPYLAGQGPGAPAIPEPPMGMGNEMGYPGATIGYQEEEVPVEGMSSALTDPSVYAPMNVKTPMDMQQVGSAMQTGQKDIFDTAVIGSMLKAVRDDTMIDRYLPNLIKGMDSLGRIMFMFYWHGDRFADRFGKADMPELEDSLRNAFEMIGDVILFLKQKTIEPYPEEDAAALDLGATANA